MEFCQSKKVGTLHSHLHNGVFPKWNRNSLNSANSGSLIYHWSMNWVQFKYPVFHKFFAGTMVASWSYTRGGWVAGLNPFNVMRNIFVTEFSEFSENIQGKLKYYTTQFWKYKHLSYSCTPLCVPVRLGQNLVFGKIFAENCMKRK